MANGKAGRPKNKIPSRKVNISGFVSPVFDSDVLEWLSSLPEGKRFASIWHILKIVVHLAIMNSGDDAAEIRRFIENGHDTITLRKMKRSVVSLKLRWEILERDKFRCVVCGRSAEDGVKLEVDHVQPWSKGGTKDKSNMATLCFDCNRGKRDRVSEESYVEVIKGGN